MDKSTLDQEFGQLFAPPRLGSYTEFRRYLLDFYNYKRLETSSDLRPYSYAHFSAAADIKSPNYLRLIIEGSRNLSLAMARKFSKALGHTREESQEFELLVDYGQTKDPMERNRKLKALNDFRVRLQMKSGDISEATWEKVPSWVTWVLYSMVDQKDVPFDEEHLFGLLRSKASLDEVKRSLKRLLDDGDLVQNEVGEVKKGRLLMAGVESVSVAMVRKIQAELIYLGLESLHHDEPHEREVGAMTIAMTDEEFEQMKFDLRQLRKKWFKDLGVRREQSKGDRVYQLNFQLFPLTDKVEGIEERKKRVLADKQREPLSSQLSRGGGESASRQDSGINLRTESVNVPLT